MNYAHGDTIIDFKKNEMISIIHTIAITCGEVANYPLYRGHNTLRHVIHLTEQNSFTPYDQLSVEL